MANVFKSKEVYKHVPGINSGDKLYAVRGMYVSGEHKVPYYIDAGVHIKSIKTNKATIKNFTTQKQDYPDHVVNLLSIEVDTSPIKLTNYTRAYQELQPDHVVNLLSIEVDDSPPSLLFYSKQYQELQPDHVVNLLSIEVLSEPSVLYYDNIKQNTLPEHMIRIKEITTTKAVVSNL